MSATQHWTEMVRLEHAQSDSMRKEDPPSDSWSNFAHQFRADPGRTDDALVNHLRRSIRPGLVVMDVGCLLYTSPSPRDQRGSRMPSSA